ncbi:hypothetical protein KI387_000742, partial [Taxus chinensis]
TKYGCERIPNSRSLHSLMTMDSNNWTICTRDYSCFCYECMNKSYSECNSKKHGYVGEWKKVPLVVDDTYGSDHDDSFEDVPLISTDYDHISGLVKQGDVFAVIAEEANIEKVEYYLLHCTEERTKLTCEITSEVTTFFTGSVVVQGTYLQQVKALQSGIHFVDYKPDKKVYHYTHHIIATGLQLQQ